MGLAKVTPTSAFGISTSIDFTAQPTKTEEPDDPTAFSVVALGPASDALELLTPQAD